MDRQELIKKYEKLIQQNEPELEESKLAESRSKLYNNILRELKRMDDEITTEQAWKKIAEKYDKSIANVEADFEDWINSGSTQTKEKPEIPKFVADWIEEVKQRGCGLADALNCFVSPIMPEKVKQWIQFDFAAIGCHHDNQELLAKAWLNGYTIEKEPVWIVKAPYDRYFGGFLEKGNHAEINFSHINRVNAQRFEDKDKAQAVATLVDGTVEEWSEKDEQ